MRKATYILSILPSSMAPTQPSLSCYLRHKEVDMGLHLWLPLAVVAIEALVDKPYLLSLPLTYRTYPIPLAPSNRGLWH
jgi:hypothetical protein